jgi:16S rRNA (cytosine967-C5)-methyltransferase
MSPRPVAASAREVALQVCRDVFGLQPRGARESLDYRLRATTLAPRDRAFATELAYGAIKMRRYLDFELDPYIGERRNTLPQPIAEILRLGTYQLRSMHGVEAYAAVSESVGLARKYGHKGTAGLVNAVLRRVAVEAPRETDLATRMSLPGWVVAHWRERFGEERLDAILAGVNATPATGIVIDLRRIDRAGAQRELADVGIATRPSPFAADVLVVEAGGGAAAIDELAAGRWHQQSESAAFGVDLLDPQPGARVVELCCGRGNKTLQLASRMRDSGTLLAIDADPRAIADNAARLADAGISSVALVAADATQLQAEPDADAVLVDAPCSGLGILGRQPEARWRKRPDDPAQAAPLQRRLLDAGATCVRPGGVLVYAVCSTDRREGEAVVDAFLADHPQFARLPLPERYAPFAHAGDVLVAPGIDGRDGFYLARLGRSEETAPA